MKSTYILHEIMAIYKCETCGHPLIHSHNKSMFYPNSFVKDCPNPKCPSIKVEDPLEGEENENQS